MKPIGLDPNDPKVRAATFGELVKDFWKSDIGQYLMERAKREAEEATAKLVTGAHAMTVKQITAAQGEIWRAEKFCEWLEEAYAQGCAALNILEEEVDGDG